MIGNIAASVCVTQLYLFLFQVLIGSEKMILITGPTYRDRVAIFDKKEAIWNFILLSFFNDPCLNPQTFLIILTSQINEETFPPLLAQQTVVDWLAQDNVIWHNHVLFELI